MKPILIIESSLGSDPRKITDSFSEIKDEIIVIVVAHSSGKGEMTLISDRPTLSIQRVTHKEL